MLKCQAMGAYGGVGGVAPCVFFIDIKCDGQLHASVALPTVEEPLDTQWIGGGLGPRCVLDVASKRISPAVDGNRTPVVQLIASHFTELSP
jgi:hypothetical protein